MKYNNLKKEKIVPEVLVKDQIKKLVEIQKIDKEVYDYNVELKEKPEMIEVLKEQFESTKSHLMELEEDAKKVQVDRKQKEVDLQGKEDEISKANTSLNDLKTNKEYQAKVKEIEHLKADKSRIEEDILLSYDASEKVNDEVEKEKVVVAGYEKEYQTKKAEVEALITDLQGKIKILESEREKLIPDIEEATLAKYQRLLDNRDGIAIAPVENNNCGGCFMSIMPQTVNAIKLAEEIIQCEYCTRMLYLEDDL